MEGVDIIGPRVVPSPRVADSAPIENQKMTQTTRTSASSERLSSRTPVKELTYVQLSEADGGLVLNIAESGIGIRAATPFKPDFFSMLRFRLPDSETWIEASGRVAWRDKSKRCVGIQFVGLPAESAEQIKRWMASQISTGTRPDAAGKARNAGSASQPRQQRVRANGDESPRPSQSAGGRIRTASPPDSGDPPARHVTRDGYVTQYSPYVPASAARHRSWWTFVIIVGLVATVSFIAGITLGPPGRSVPLRGAEQGVTGSDTGALAPSSPATAPSATDAETPPSADQFSASASANVTAPANTPDTPSTENSTSTPGSFNSDNLGEQTKTPTTSSRDTRPPKTVDSAQEKKTATLAEKAPPQRPERSEAAPQNPPSAPSQPAANTVTADRAPTPPADGSSTGPSASASSSDASQKNSPSPLAAPNAASAAAPVAAANSTPQEIPSETVTHTSRFVSIRVTPEMSAQSSKLTGSLQIGQLVSSSQPGYPADAARQGIEGTVRLRAIVGPDGSVQKVEPVSGPGPLQAAAAEAVRSWLYGPTLVGNQRVGAEESVTFTFKLSPQTGHPH